MCKNHLFRAVLFVVLALQASFAINISACTNISGPGEYELAAGLTGAGVAATAITGISEACILIRSDNVTLDCNGQTITNNGTSDAVAIAANGSSSFRYDNVTIQNCPSISGYEIGIFGYYLSNATISNNTVRDASAEGIFLEMYSYSPRISNNTIINTTGDGIRVRPYATNSLIDSNILEYTSGMYVQVSDYSNISNNSISHTTGMGMELSTCDYLNVADNTVHNASNHGIYLGSSSDYNNLTGNEVHNVTNTGFYITSSPSTLLANNTIYDADMGIIIVSTSTYTAARDNTIYDIGDTAIDTYASASSTFSGNAIYNAATGISMYSGANFNTLLENTVYECGIGINAWNGITYTNITNNTIYGNNYGVVLNTTTYPNLSGNTVYDNDYGLFFRIATYASSSDDHVYNSAEADLYIYPSTANRATNITGLIIDGASGGYSQYSNLTLHDSVDANTLYTLKHASSPSASYPGSLTSFLGKFVNISITNSSSIDSIAWHYTDSEASDYNESTLALYRYVASYTDTESALDQPSNALTNYSLSASGVYGILGDSFWDGGEDDGSEVPEAECKTHADCPDCYRCVGGDCTLPADSCASPSDCSGAYPFYGCSGCSCEGYECSVDEDCSGEGETCEDGECVPPECIVGEDCALHGEGYACEEYSCIPPECIMDEDCPEGYSCEDYACVPPECFTDEGCQDGKICENYRCVDWKCFTNADCEEGFACVFGACTPGEKPSGTGGPSSSRGGAGTPHRGEAEVLPVSPDAREGIARYGFPLVEGDGGNPVIPDIVVNEKTSVSGVWAIFFLLVLIAAIYAIALQRRAKGGRGQNGA
jgi:parallel beta-helix repeat protein